MKLQDNTDLRGEFSIKAYKKDGSVEVYSDKNLIMDDARVNMAKLIGGLTLGTPINKIVLGTKGHVDPNIIDYKLVGEHNFISSRQFIFSEDIAADGALGAPSADGSTIPNFSYEITFDTASSSLDYTDVNAQGSISNVGKTITDPNPAVNVCSVQRIINNRTCTFIVNIPDYAANSATDGTVAYTEAALYAGPDIFSMKTFPARVKENTVRLELTWSIIF